MEIVKEDYVSFEIAKLLKEKGFDNISSIMYKENGEMCINPKSVVSWRLKYWYPCLTLQMAMRWLREVHNIYYEIQLLLGEKAEKYGDLQLGIYQLSSSGTYIWKEWIYADTYVELYKSYIKYCLKNLI